MRSAVLVAFSLVATPAYADEVIEGVFPEGGPDFVVVPFEVPAGTVEIEVRHTIVVEANVIDYGLIDPDGAIRGWGGGNREPIVVGEAAASRSYLVGPISAGTWQVLLGRALVKETPARYSLEILLRDAATLEPDPDRGPYVPATLATGERWYAGDFHVHSRDSGDADATLDEIGALAAERGLDFVVITDHNTRSQVDLLAAAQARHPTVLFIPGVELTSYAGHANGIDVTATIDHRIGIDGRTMSDVAADVAARGGLFSINHPVLDFGDACIGCAWMHDVPVELVDAVEIGTGAAAIVFAEDALTFWDALLDAGAKSAALGGSDDHRAGRDTGITASRVGTPATYVYATELSARGIVEGIRSGRTVVKLGGPDAPMVTIAREGTTLTAEITGGDGAQLVWVRNGRRLEEVTVSGDRFTHTRTITLPTAEGDVDRYRAELVVDGLRSTVTSHLFVGVEPEEEGCGCATTARGGAALPLLLLLAFTGARFRRRARR